MLYTDEKSQIEAPAHTQLILSLVPSTPVRMSQHSERAGTSSLVAAIGAATGWVTRSLQSRHSAIEVKMCFQKSAKQVTAGLHVHLILDNYVTHTTLSPQARRTLLHN